MYINKLKRVSEQKKERVYLAKCICFEKQIDANSGVMW